MRSLPPSCRSARSRAAVAVLGALSALSAPGTARAQAPAPDAAPNPAKDPAPRATVTADLAATSAFVWRGVTNTNRPVLGPTLSLSAPVRGLTVTTGLWGNVEPAAYTGPRDLSTYGGAYGPALTMSQVWVEAKRSLPGDGALTLGATEYHYPRVGDLARIYETAEVYALAAGGGPLAPSFGVWVDVRKVRGAYAEAAVSRGAALPAALPRWLGDGHRVTLGGALGYSAGMGARDGQTAYFARDGVTHAELSATTELGLGAVTLLPTAHLVLGRDAAVRLVSPDVTRGAKLWVGASLHWSGAVRAARRPGRAHAAAGPVAGAPAHAAPHAAVPTGGAPDGSSANAAAPR